MPSPDGEGLRQRAPTTARASSAPAGPGHRGTGQPGHRPPGGSPCDAGGRPPVVLRGGRDTRRCRRRLRFRGPRRGVGAKTLPVSWPVGRRVSRPVGRHGLGLAADRGDVLGERLGRTCVALRGADPTGRGALSRSDRPAGALERPRPRPRWAGRAGSGGSRRPPPRWSAARAARSPPPVTRPGCPAGTRPQSATRP